MEKLLTPILTWDRLIDRIGDPFDEHISQTMQAKSLKDCLLEEINNILEQVNSGAIKASEILLNNFFQKNQEEIMYNIKTVLDYEEMPDSLMDNLEVIFFQR